MGFQRVAFSYLFENFFIESVHFCWETCFALQFWNLEIICHQILQKVARQLYAFSKYSQFAQSLLLVIFELNQHWFAISDIDALHLDLLPV